MRTYNNLTELVGNTPIVKINKINDGVANIYAKLEMFNPLSSAKDRAALSMIEDAEKSGKLKAGGTIIEPTSGNTGVGIAYISAIKGYKSIFTMPDTMSVERRALLKALGAEIVLTEGAKGMTGAINRATELCNEIPGAIMMQQFENGANSKVHFETTGVEIWDDMAGNVDIFVAGVGTGGTLTGVGEYLKSKNPDVKIVAVEPASSPVLSGGSPAPHKIQGIGAGFVPKILNTEIYDEIITVSNDDAMDNARKVAKEEGILVGISSGASLTAALELSKRAENKGKNIVVFFADTGERYLSVIS